jgi:hypothetical protein
MEAQLASVCQKTARPASLNGKDALTLSPEAEKRPEVRLEGPSVISKRKIRIDRQIINI